jgi:hypothetical protein
VPRAASDEDRRRTDLKRPESENVARLTSDVRSREMKADLEEQKNDAKLGEQVKRRSR